MIHEERETDPFILMTINLTHFTHLGFSPEEIARMYFTQIMAEIQLQEEIRNG